MEVWLFAQHAYDARIRRLAMTLRADYLERAVFEWIGTALQDRQFAGIRASLALLEEQGAALGGGVDAYYWTPSRETISQELSPSDMAAADGGPVLEGSPIHYLQHNTEAGKAQILAKLKRHIELGAAGVHIDEYDHGAADNIGDVIARLRTYARESHGRSIQVSTNSRGYGGQDFTMYHGARPDGTEQVDFYVRTYPLRLQGVPEDHDFTGAESEPFDGTYNLIPAMRQAHRGTAPKRFYYFIDFAGACFVAPKDFGVWPQYMRIAEAQIMAAGGIPGAFRSFYNQLGAYERGLHALVANRVKFIREHRLLWRDLTWIEPQVLRTSGERVWMSALRQPERTLLHLVNGRYDNARQAMEPQRQLQVELSVDEPVERIWLTTPDRLWHQRRLVLERGDYACADGVVTLQVPALDYHVIVVLEHGRPWEPVYEPMTVVFPFPNRTQLPAGNETRFVALPTEGMTSTLAWTIERIDGDAADATDAANAADEAKAAHAADAGSIDEHGRYRAPADVAEPMEVCLRAASREEPSVYAELRLVVIPSLPLPWRAAAEELLPDSTATRDSVPGAWEIVEGRGDWQTTIVEEEEGLRGIALHNTNIAEATVEPAVQGGAGYATLLSGGDQSWRDYEYRLRWTSLEEPIVWYGLDSERPQTYAGFVFRYRNVDDYYMYQCGYDGHARLYRYADGVRRELGEAAPCRYPAVRESCDVTIHAVGDDFCLSIDGSLIRDDRGAGEGSVGSGAIGLGTSFTENRFELIEVRESSRPLALTDEDIS